MWETFIFHYPITRDLGAPSEQGVITVLDEMDSFLKLSEVWQQLHHFHFFQLETGKNLFAVSEEFCGFPETDSGRGLQQYSIASGAGRGARPHYSTLP